MSLLIPIFAGLFISDTMPRYFLFLAPVYSLMIAKGISTLPLVKIRAVLLVAITVLLSFSLKNYYTNKEFHILSHIDSWREVGDYLKENVRTEDIIFNIGGVPINHYTGFELPVLEGNAMQVIKQELQNKAWQSGEIYLIVSNPKYKKEGEDAIKWMAEHYPLISEKKYVRDPDYVMKTRFFRKDFMEYRIRVYFYENQSVL